MISTVAKIVNNAFLNHLLYGPRTRSLVLYTSLLQVREYMLNTISASIITDLERLCANRVIRLYEAVLIATLGVHNPCLISENPLT